MKNNIEFNGLIKGIRFNGGSLDQWRLYPNTWLYDEKNGQWYLCEFFTPLPLVNMMPWKIKNYPHKIWKVDKKIVENGLFRLHKPRSDSSKNILGITIISTPLGILSARFLEWLSTKVSSSNTILDRFDGFLVELISFIIFGIIVFFLYKILKNPLLKSIEKNYVDMPQTKKIIDEIKMNSNFSYIKVESFKINLGLYFFEMIISFLMVLFLFFSWFVWLDTLQSKIIVGIISVMMISGIIGLQKMKPINGESNPDIKILFRKL